MKLNKKGFTLTELLAIIVILAVIMIIAAPNMTRQISKKETMDKNILNEKIENAAKVYVAKYYANEVISGSGTITFTLNDLQQDGLINLTKNSNCQADLNDSITITVSSMSYNYNNLKNNDSDGAYYQN